MPFVSPDEISAPVVDAAQPQWRESIRRDFMQFRMQIQRECGDVVNLQMPHAHIHQITHPEDVAFILKNSGARFLKGSSWDHLRQMIGNGVITAEPPRWLEQRRALQPTFLRRYHDRFAARIAHSIEDTNTRWRAAVNDGKPIQVALEMAQLTLENAGHTLFDTDLRAHIPALSRDIIVVLNYLQGWFGYQTHKRILGGFVAGSRHQRYRRALKNLENIAGEIVRRRQDLRRQNESENHDLLAALLDSPRGENAKIVRDEMLTFLFTGHETTAMTISWTWHALAENPAVEERLHAELAGVLQGRIPTRADLPHLPFLRRVVSEVLRLYPPVWVLMRQTTQSETFRGVTIPAGANLSILPYVTHRHSDFWQRPETFDPQRFTPEKEAARAPGAYIPFGSGPRQCMGKHTALLETQLVIGGLAQHWKLRFAPGAQIKPVPGITLWPSQNLPMFLQPRIV
jgi:cytochrome P450